VLGEFCGNTWGTVDFVGILPDAMDESIQLVEEFLTFIFTAQSGGLSLFPFGSHQNEKPVITCSFFLCCSSPCSGCISSNFSDLVASQRRRRWLLTRTHYPSWPQSIHGAGERFLHGYPHHLGHHPSLGVHVQA